MCHRLQIKEKLQKLSISKMFVSWNENSLRNYTKRKIPNIGFEQHQIAKTHGSLGLAG